jgi:DNA polymerase-3 subunit chi
LSRAPAAAQAMTEITFHFNVGDRSGYACRLLRKATRRGARVAVTGPADVLEQLDRQLWAFDPVEFIPHLRLESGAAPGRRAEAAPVWLVEDPSRLERHEVLVNLGPDAPAGFESFGKLIEIVSTSEDDRAAARARWKHYASRGYPIARHEAVE